MTATLAGPNSHRDGCYGLLAPLGWPAPRPAGRQLHRMLASLADLLDAVATAHQLTTELAVQPDAPGQGWQAALAAIDTAAVGATDTCWLIRLLADHGMDTAAGHLRRGLDHRIEALQLVRRAVRTDQIAALALDPRQIAGLLAAVTSHLEQAGRALAAADQTVITITLETRP
jgi:hypothetical protein